MFKKVSWCFLCLTILFISGLYWQLKRELPSLKGEVIVSGLEKPVTIYRDDRGVPHLQAENEKDLAFALGHLIASERLFQMDTYRRLATGRLSEWLGSPALKADRLFRTLGLAHYAAQIWEKEREMAGPAVEQMEAFVAGVNHFIDENPIPLEYFILGARPEPFTASDAISFIGYMSYSFAMAFKKDLLFNGLKEKMPFARFNELRSIPLKKEKKKLTTMASPIDFSSWEQAHLWVQNNFPLFIGSNAWALAPERGESGGVLLANDPHLGFSLPGIWFEAHVKTPEYEMYGHYIPLLPFPILGHGHKYGWGMTVSYVDDMDFYRENIRPMDSGSKEVYYKGKWVPLKKRKEPIVVRFGKDEELILEEGPHGPLLGNIIDQKNISMKWAFHHPDNLVLSALHQLSHASNPNDFKKAVEIGKSPGLNIIYGDKEGNIGLFMFGAIPLRPSHVQGDLILDGASGRDEYLGYLPFSEYPSIWNPASGQIVSANHLPPQKNGPDIQGYWVSGDRYHTIRQELLKKEKWTVQEMSELQNKNINSRFKHWIGTLQKIPIPLSFTLWQKARALEFMSWSGEASVESRNSLIMYEFLAKVMSELLTDLNSEQYIQYCRTNDYWYTFGRLMADGRSALWDDPTTIKIEERDERLWPLFAKTLEDMQKKYGSNEKDWRWGEHHTLTFVHPLGRFRPLNWIFNLGPFPAPGGYGQVNNYRRVGCERGHQVIAGPSTRRVIDFASPMRSLGGTPLGVSGHLLSPFFDNQRDNYMKGAPRVQLMDWQEIERSSYNLRMLPKAQ